jgi:hypothetical protein
MSEATIGFTIAEPDGSTTRLAVMTAAADFKIELSAHLTDAEADALAGGSGLAERAIKTAKVQKLLEQEQPRLAAFEQRAQRHVELLEEFRIVTSASGKYVAWPAAELDGTILRLTFTARISAPIALKRPVDIDDDEGCAVAEASPP